MKIQFTKIADVTVRDAANELATALSADVVQVIGRTATLYRENPELKRKDGVPPWRSQPESGVIPGALDRAAAARTVLSTVERREPMNATTDETSSREFAERSRRATSRTRLDEEMRFHLDMHASGDSTRGVDWNARERDAIVAFGGREPWREAVRDEYRASHLEGVWQDARYAVRTLRK